METEYGACVIATVEDFRRLIDPEEYMLHTKNQLLILDDLQLSKDQLIRSLSLVSELQNYVN